MSQIEEALPDAQAAVFGTVSHYYDLTGEPCPSAYVARKLRIARPVVWRHFQKLFEKGWLRGPTSPAIPARSLPLHPEGGNRNVPRGVTGTYLGKGSPAGDLVPMHRAAEGQPETIEILPLSVRADLTPKSVDNEARTVELVFTTGAAVERYDWMRGVKYLETLSLNPSHVRLDRLNGGGPVLDAHSGWSVASQIGAVVPGTVKLAGKEGRATARFSRRASVEPIWQDIRDGIIRSVSVGYRVYRFEETAGKENALPVRRAVDWEPFEISMVPIPADAGAKVRDGDSAEPNACEIVTRDAGPTVTVPVTVRIVAETEEKKAMHEDKRSETILEPDPLEPPAAPAQPATPTEREEGATAERERTLGIRQACLAGKMPRSFEEKLIIDGIPLLEAQKRIFAELAKRDDPVPSNASRPADVVIVGDDDPFVHVRSGIENAILHRLYPETVDGGRKLGFGLTEEGRRYRGMTLLDVAKTFLRARGVRTTGMSKMEVAGLALGLNTRGGMHTTSDFANLLADVASKMLRRAYEEAPQTWVPLSRRTTLPDFKLANRVQLGEAPALEQVLEHGEFKRGSITEGKEQFKLLTYGKIFAITRTALVNDDTDAFSRIPMLFGRAARHKESDLVWAQITGNPTMGDSVTLFHTATHGNLAAAGAAISIDTISAGRAAMRVQKGLDGVTNLNLFPRFIIVPAAKETVADQFVSQNLQASESSKVNPFAGRLQPIAEPRLDANSTTAWYLSASPDQVDILEHAYLEGEEGPMVESRVGFDVDGLEVKCRHDFGTKVIDWRGLYKNPGA